MNDYALGTTIYLHFTTRSASVPTALAGTAGSPPGAEVKVLEQNNTTPITAGIALNIDRASVTGLNEVEIVASGANGYESGKAYAAYISNGTVGGTSVVGEIIGTFTIEKQSALRPTTAGRTLNVAATGEGDANVQQVNDVAVAGNGQAGNTWGP
jgi:hypothetical protein